MTPAPAPMLPARPVVGFVGLGRIGLPMAGRAARAGFPLVGFDIAAAANAALLAAAPKALLGTSPADVADRSDIVVGCLQTVEQYRAAILGRDGIVRGDRAKLYVHVGTTGRALLLELAAELATRGIVVVDAPMSGGVAGARAGTLVSMTAGPADACAAIEPLLAAWSKRIVRLGAEPGLAQTMKLVNNMLSAANLAVACEVMAVGAKAGLPVETMLDVLNAGTGQNSATLTKIPNNVVTRRFDTGSTLANVEKDLSAYAAEAVAAGIDSALCRAILACYLEAGRQSSMGDDISSVARPFERATGAVLARRDTP